MPSRPTSYQPRERRSRQAVDLDRGSARERGYTREWDKASAAFLEEHPLCQYCEAGVFGPPRVSASRLTDHLYPHRAHAGVFWLRKWWVASCRDCHDGPKQAAEGSGLNALHALADRLGRERLIGRG